MKSLAMWPKEEKPDDSPAAKAFRLLQERRNLRRKMHNPNLDHLFKMHEEFYRRIGLKLRDLPVTRPMIREYAASIKPVKFHRGQARGRRAFRADHTANSAFMVHA